MSEQGRRTGWLARTGDALLICTCLVLILTSPQVHDWAGQSSVAEWIKGRRVRSAWDSLVVSQARYPLQGGGPAIVEFADYECPACRASYAANPPRQGITVIYHHLPLASHPQAEPAARASICAEAQGRFVQMHAYLFTDTTWFKSPDWVNIAASVGVADVVAFRGCLRSPATETRLAEDRALAGRLGITATPTYLGSSGGRKVGLADGQALIDLSGEPQ